MSCGIDGTVEQLIDLLIENHNPDWIAFLLEREGFLACNIRQSISDDPTESWSPELKEALYRLYAQFSPYEATKRIADKAKLIDIVNQLGKKAVDSEQIDPNESLDELVKKTLHSLAIPLYPKAIRLYGQSSTLTSLQKIQRDLSNLKGENPTDLGAIQGLTITVWASVEQLLKTTIRFYVRHFAAVPRVANQLQNAFEEAAKEQSLGRLLHGFADVESIFRIGETDRERQKREKPREQRIKEAKREAQDMILARQKKLDRYRILERSRQDIDEIEGKMKTVEEEIRAIEEELEVNLEQERKEKEFIDRQKSSLASDLREEFFQDFGRNSPFEGFVGIPGRRKIPKRRNFYAHRTFSEIYEKHGVEGALETVEEAIRLVIDLGTKRIAPETIILTGLGQDCYGRELIYFVREDNITQDGYVSLDRIEVMFKEHSFYSPYATCLMHRRANEDNVCNPVIYYLDEVID